MAKFNFPKNNFSIGEISPRLLGRSDTPTYQNGAETLTNVRVLIGGGVTRRAGTKYIGGFKSTSADVRLVPFVIGSNEYVLEFGNLYMRVWKSDALVYEAGPGAPIYELVTPYAIADVNSLSIAPNGQVVYITHGSYQPRKLIWTSDIGWQLLTLDVPIFLRPYGTEQITITPSATTGASITLTASASLFDATWIGRTIKINGGYVTISAFTNSQVVTAGISSTAYHDGYVITTVTIPYSANSGGLTVLTEANYKSSLFETEVSLVPAVDTVRKYVEYSGNSLKQICSTTLTAAKEGQAVKAYVKTKMDTYSKHPIAQTTTSTLLYGSLTAATETLPITGLEADYNWTVKLVAAHGWPRICCIHEQRLWLGGNTVCPSTLWSSKIGDFEDFTASTLADGGCIFRVAGDNLGEINHLVSSEVLEIYTTGNELAVIGGEMGIKPDDVKIKSISNYGSATVAPLRIAGTTIFVPRGGKAIRQTQLRVETVDKEGNDISALAEHLLDVGIVGMAYHRQERTLYIVLSNGTWATVSLDSKQGLQAWSLNTTASGLVKRVCCLQGSAGDKIYFSVMRNGSMVLEKVDSAYNTDSTVASTEFNGATVWSGYDHLEGRSVDVVADGLYQPRETVVSGDITISRTAYNLYAGMPYTTTIKDLPVDVQGGTIQGSHVSVNEVSLRLLDTANCKLNGQWVAARRFTVQTDVPPEEITGIQDIHIIQGWLDNGQITITQDVPLSMTVLGIYKKVSVND